MGRAPRPAPPPPVAAPPPPRILDRAHDGLPVAPLPARPVAPVAAPHRAAYKDDDEDEEWLRNLLRLRAMMEVNRIEGRRQALDG